LIVAGLLNSSSFCGLSSYLRIASGFFGVSKVFATVGDFEATGDFNSGFAIGEWSAREST
jgi:hypothetical protein